MYNILFSVIQRLLQTLCIVWNFCLMNPCIFSWNTGIFWTFNIQVVFLTKLKIIILIFWSFFVHVWIVLHVLRVTIMRPSYLTVFIVHVWLLSFTNVNFIWSIFRKISVCGYITPPPPTSHTKYLKLKLLHHCFYTFKNPQILSRNYR